jgi:hypothetical protein
MLPGAPALITMLMLMPATLLPLFFVMLWLRKILFGR